MPKEKAAPRHRGPAINPALAAALMDTPAVDWSPADTALFLSSIGLGAAGKTLAAFVEAQEVPGYMLVANSNKAEDLVEMFGEQTWTALSLARFAEVREMPKPRRSCYLPERQSNTGNAGG